MNMHHLIEQAPPSRFSAIDPVSTIKTLLMLTCGWQPPETTDTPLKMLIGAAPAGSTLEQSWLEQARKDAASLMLVRADMPGPLRFDIAYNGCSKWIWHRNLALWLDCQNGKPWFVPGDPHQTTYSWTIDRGDLLGHEAPPFDNAREERIGLQAGADFLELTTGW